MPLFSPSDMHLTLSFDLSTYGQDIFKIFEMFENTMLKYSLPFQLISCMAANV